MDQPSRLDHLLEELVADPAWERGERRPVVPVSADDGATIAEGLSAEVDGGAAARAEAALAAGLVVACGRGCAGCCEELVLVYLPEAAAVARWLREPANRPLAERFLARLPAWRAAVGLAAAELAELHQRGDGAAYHAAHVAQWRRRIPCAFLDDHGVCTIYPVRPVTCRNAHAVDGRERCFADAPPGRPAARLAFPPLDQYLVEVDRLLRALHHAMGGQRRRAEALCLLVGRLLEEAHPPRPPDEAGPPEPRRPMGGGRPSGGPP